MIPSKRPLTLRPLPTTSQPKAMLAKKATTATAAKVAKAPRERKERPKWIWGVAAGILVLVGVGGAYAMGYIGHRDKLAEVRDLQAKMQDKNLSDDDRRALGGEMWDKMRTLPQDQRDLMREEGRDMMETRGAERMEKFFAMSPADQTKELDKVIDDIEKREKERADKQAASGKGKDSAAGGKGDGSGRGNGGNGGDSQGGGRGRRGGFGGASDPTQPNAAHDRRLSSTTGEARAERGIGRQLRTVYNNMLQSRAQQRGVTVPSGGPGMGGMGRPRG